MRKKYAPEHVMIRDGVYYYVRHIPCDLIAYYNVSRHCSLEGNKSDYASNGLNKWLRPLVPDGCVVHSFRHSFRDRLRAVECPPDIIDQLGGWKTSGVGQSYGEGYQINVTSRWMQAIVLPESAAEPLSRCE